MASALPLRARPPASSRLWRARATGCGVLGNDLIVMVVVPIGVEVRPPVSDLAYR
ncbi:hypothetical protein D3C72_1637350 [compost metagenome]